MVCSKCQKKLKATELATPGVKRKNDMYYGSPSSTLGGGADKGKSKATLGATGIGKVCYKIRHSILLKWIIILDEFILMSPSRANSSARKRRILMRLMLRLVITAR